MVNMKKKRPRGGASYLCPLCNSSSSVVVTRRDETGLVQRHRQCARRSCAERFNTVERLVREPAGKAKMPRGK